MALLFNFGGLNWVSFWRRDVELVEITERLSKVSDIYAERFNIDRDRDWYLLKIQEELGELSKVFLQMTQRARRGDPSTDLQKDLHDELADVLAMTLLFSRAQGIDVEKALSDKWFRHLE